MNATNTTSGMQQVWREAAHDAARMAQKYMDAGNAAAAEYWAAQRTMYVEQYVAQYAKDNA
jgi:hypothetical protein